MAAGELLGEGDSRVGLASTATSTLEEVWQPLLSAALQEFDHRVDQARHAKLLEEADICTLVPVERLTRAIQQEMQAATRTSSKVTLESGRDLATVAYDLAAFVGHEGPYTLHEIYQAFSFCDKIALIQQQAVKGLESVLRPAGCGLAARIESGLRLKVAEAEEAVAEAVAAEASKTSEDCKEQEPDVEHAEQDAADDSAGEPEDMAAMRAEEEVRKKSERQERARWFPPSPNRLELWLRAGANFMTCDGSRQTSAAHVCEAAALCIREAAQDAVWDALAEEDEIGPQAGQDEKATRARRLDEGCAEALRFIVAEAPSTLFVDDLLGRSCFIILAEAFGLIAELPKPQLGEEPTATLRALCDSVQHCFSKAPTSLLWCLRNNESLRTAVEEIAGHYKDDEKPEAIVRLLNWIEVVMGGAWEVAEEEPDLLTRALLDTERFDVEEMVDTSVRLRDFTDKMEQQVLEWKAEEAELKLLEFEARCAKKAAAYEDRIARLEAEIARRAGSAARLPKAKAVPASAPEVPESATEEPQAAPKKAAEPRVVARIDDGTLAEAKRVVESIRADRLVNCEWEEGIAEEVKAGLLDMRRSLCAAVERLALDLYADECHCLWELIQNADDNKYASDVEVPELSLALEVDSSHGAFVWTSNNEIGLSVEDVKAICNVNASLKGVGQTGHKGIGWKSVFRISDCPHVLSREFAFKFDTVGPLGKLAFVTPTNLTDEEIESLPAAVKEAKDAGRTVMFLPLRAVSDASAVEAELKQIAAQHLCLAFLRQLRCLQLRFPDGRRMVLERCQAQYAQLYFPDASDITAVKISDEDQVRDLRMQMPEYVLHHQTVTWEDEETAQLSLAFPASFATGEDEADEDDGDLLQAPLQPLFTFLPVKVVGFRFAVQGPFELTADRANLHGKSARNRALCGAIPVAFRAALERLPGLRRRALDLLGQETPEAAWLLVRGELLEVLREVDCIPTEPDGALAKPGECLLPPEEQKLAEAMQHLPAEVLWGCCRRRLVRKKWALSHRAQCRGLGLKEISIDHWLQVLGLPDKAGAGADPTEAPATRSLVKEAAGKQDHAFFRRIFGLLGSTVSERPEVLEQLKQVPLIPDAAGHALTIADGPTLSNHAGDVPLEWQKALEAAGALRVLAPAVTGALCSVGQRLLRELGVMRPTRHDIVPLCVRWHTSLSSEPARQTGATPGVGDDGAESHRDGNLQCGGSSGSNAVPKPDAEHGVAEISESSGQAGRPTASVDTATRRSAVWASLACLRNHFLTGSVGAPEEKGGELTPWRELGARLLLPCSSRRSGFGPGHWLTCPTYLGEAVGSELQHDVLVAIMGFIHGVETEARDIGVCSDSPPPWLRDEKEKGLDGQDSMTTDRLKWEAFLDALGLKPLSPCTSHRKVAGTILTIDLGWRLSSSEWWKAAMSSKIALAYLERRLNEADRVEITWLKQLRTPERVEVSELFLRSAYVRYGGHFLPYMELPQSDAPVSCLACLRRLGVATDLTGSGLRKCLQVLEGRACHDLSVFADVYGALAALPPEEQASTGSWGSQVAPGKAHIFVPPASFRKAEECVWTDNGKSTLRWVCGYVALQPEYGRFGNLCRAWLLGPNVAVQQDLQCLEVSAFLGALRTLIRQADAASRIPLQERSKRLAGPDSPTAKALLDELQQVAVQAYKHLAQCCRAAAGEDRNRAETAVALAFQHEALLILTDKEWDKPKRLKSQEAFWDVHSDVASSKAAKLALKNRLPADDLDELKTFLVDIVGIPERLTQQDLEARLRVPLSQGPEQQSSFNEGFGLNDFEDIATIRRGPGVVGQGGEGDDFFEPASDLPEGEATYATERPAEGRAAGPGPAAGGDSTSGPSASSAEPAGASAESAASRPEEASSASAAAGDAGREAGPPDGEMPSSSSQQPSQMPAEAPEEEEEDDFDWEGEDACDPYKVLRVQKGADEETIRRSYKRLALKYHPDKNRGSETALKRFQAISAAYDILRDPEKRKAYDDAAARDKAKRSQARARPPSMSAEEAREVFRSFFGGQDPFDVAAAGLHRPAPSRMEGGASSSRDAFTVRSDAPPAPSEGQRRKTKRLSKEEYDELFRELQEAEASAKMWSEEVETARQQLREAEETRDRYLRILQDCYDRTSKSAARGL